MDLSQINKKLNSEIKLGTPKRVFVLVLLVLITTRIIYVLFPTKMFWDASVYIGMAKYLASFGKVGVWEFFRPPVLPIMFSIGEFIGLPIIVWTKFLTLLAGAGSMYLIYKIGEKIRPFAGVFASLALGVSTLFFSYSSVPITEVYGVFFSLLALYFLITREFYFVSGLLVGLCFLVRFPYGLLAPIFCLSFFYFDWREKNLRIQFLKRASYFSVGFLIVLVSYLFSNYFLYGDFFSPLITGIGAIGSYTIWIYQRDPGFYEKVLFLQNPLFLFFILTVYLTFFKGFFSEKKYIIYLLITWFSIFFLYFNITPHKEARFIITIFPAISLLAGISISYFYSKYKSRLFYFLLVIFIAITLSQTDLFLQTKSASESYKGFYSFLKNEYGKTVITSSPMLIAYSPVKIVEGYDRWELFKKAYEENRFRADFLLIDSCELFVCVPGSEISCDNYKKEVLDSVYKNESIIYDNTINSCHQIIAKIKKG